MLAVLLVKPQDTLRKFVCLSPTKYRYRYIMTGLTQATFYPGITRAKSRAFASWYKSRTWCAASVILWTFAGLHSDVSVYKVPNDITVCIRSVLQVALSTLITAYEYWYCGYGYLSSKQLNVSINKRAVQVRRSGSRFLICKLVINKTT